MQIYQLPLPHDDESLYSLAARIRSRNAARNDHDACCTMFGISKCTRVDEFPVNLTHFLQQTKGAFGDEQSILATFTLAEYFSRLSSKVWHSGSQHLSPLQSRYGLVTLSHGSASRWQYCVRCLAQDRELWGTGYWRRSHQLPGTILCPMHGTRLSRIPSSTLIQRLRFMLPDDVEPEKMEGQLDIEENRYTLARIADLNAKILWYRDPSFDFKSLQPAIRSELTERGFLASDGKLLQDGFWREFQNYYAGLRNISEYTSLFDSHAKIRIAGNLSRDKFPCSSLHTAFVIDYLFGSWEAMFEHCRWSQIFNITSPGPRPQNRVWPPQDDLLHAHRAACLSLIDKFPGLERNALARAAPRSFRWLLTHDTAWLSSTIPCHPPASQRRLPKSNTTEVLRQRDACLSGGKSAQTGALVRYNAELGSNQGSMAEP